MQPGKQFPAAAAPSRSRAHVVQFYEDVEYLGQAAADFLAEGILAGEPALVIATAANLAVIADYLANREIDVEALGAQGRYAFHDADLLLARIMVDSMPDPARVEALIGGEIEELVRIAGGSQIRVYGEMVNLALRAGNPGAALRLEQLSNELRAAHSCSIFCGYQLGAFRDQSHAKAFADICACHTQVLPAETYVRAGSEESRMREIARLQQRARSLDLETGRRKELEIALAQAMAQKRQAEILLEQAASLHDDFLPIASRELGNPLNLIHLQLMGILQAAEQGRQAYSPEWISYRIRHAAEEIKHISLLFESLMDVSRAGGPELHFEEGCLAGILREIVDGLQLAAQDRGISTELPAVAGRWDGHRIAQALTPLLSNAVRGGPGDKPVKLALVATPNTATISVTDETGEIARPDAEPLSWSRRPDMPNECPPLDLWIASQLARAMEGNFAIRKRAGQGFTFFMTLPRRLSS